MENNNSSTGLGFVGILFLLFLTLKLTKTIDWSWWWITAPLWGPIALVVSFLVLCLIVVGVASLGERWKRKN